MTKKVLIVDDSALMRRTLSDIINSDALLEVKDIADNGQEALDALLVGRKYDIVLLDIVMPKMSGVQFLREINKYKIHIPVVIVSSIASKSAKETIEALSLGAFDFVKKPSGVAGQELKDFQRQLLMRVYLACGIHVDAAEGKGKDIASTALQKGNTMPARVRGKRLVVIASSTGGPKALQSVIPYFPADFPYPIVVVQHMPTGFTASLASRLDSMSLLTVKEAQDGEEIKAGYVYIAQGGKQCELLEREQGIFVLSEQDKPARGGLKPCADIFLESLAETSLDYFVCGVLTGMGSDGCKGIQFAKRYKQMRVVAQDKGTSVVYGMPRAVAEAGVVDVVVPLEDVANAMIKQLGV